jgi:hypothetical protein
VQNPTFVGLTRAGLSSNFADVNTDKIMSKKKNLEKTPLDDEVIFVSPEGIKSLETAIESLEHVYKEVEKATKKKVQTP